MYLRPAAVVAHAPRSHHLTVDGPGTGEPLHGALLGGRDAAGGAGALTRGTPLLQVSTRGIR